MTSMMQLPTSPMIAKLPTETGCRMQYVVCRRMSNEPLESDMQLLGGYGGSPRRLRNVSRTPRALLRVPESPSVDCDDGTTTAHGTQPAGQSASRHHCLPCHILVTTFEAGLECVFGA